MSTSAFGSKMVVVSASSEGLSVSKDDVVDVNACKNVELEAESEESVAVSKPFDATVVSE